jgi:hypothetical protein
MTSSSFPRSRWLGIEAIRKSLPVLIRLRVFDSRVPDCPELLVVKWAYPLDSASQLPSADFYSRLERFENEAIETAETRELGVLAAVETGLGATSQFFYAKSADLLAQYLDAALQPNEDAEFSSDKDSEWREHQRFLLMAGSGHSLGRANSPGVGPNP